MPTICGTRDADQTDVCVVQKNEARPGFYQPILVLSRSRSMHTLLRTERGFVDLQARRGARHADG